MGRAYDFAFRPIAGEPDPGSGGGCDERPHRVELYSAETDPAAPVPTWSPFSLCAEHATQLAGYDARLRAAGRASRFRSARP